MIEKGCNVNITPGVSIHGVTVRASIVLYAIHRIAVIHSSTLPPEEKGELEEVILNNLSLLIEAGADINMTSEFLTEDIFREFITEPVMIYRPVQFAVAKQQDEVVKFLLERGANPHKPLHPDYPEYYPVHIACMKVSNNAPDTLEALFPPGNIQVNPNALTNDGSTPLHSLAEAAVMRVKKLATTYANRCTEEQIRIIQINHIGVIEAVDLRMMSEILQKYGTKFDQKNNHQQMALGTVQNAGRTESTRPTG